MNIIERIINLDDRYRQAEESIWEKGISREEFGSRKREADKLGRQLEIRNIAVEFLALATAGALAARYLFKADSGDNS